MSIKDSQKMIIVNTNPNLAPMLRERFSAHIDGFDEKRILKVCESCEEILPKILNSMLDKKVPKKKSMSTQKRVGRSKDE